MTLQRQLKHDIKVFEQSLRLATTPESQNNIKRWLQVLRSKLQDE